MKTLFFTLKIFYYKNRISFKENIFFLEGYFMEKRVLFPMEEKKNISASINAYNTAINFQHKIQDYFN